MIYFATANTSKQFEVCERYLRKCNFIKNFYKFLKNKEYTINVYSYKLENYNKFIFKKHMFGVFNKQNIQDYTKFEFGISNKNEVYFYSLPKMAESFYLIDFNVYDFYYSGDELESIEDIYEALPNINFNHIDLKSKYYEFRNNSDIHRHIFVVPKLNNVTKTLEKCTVVLSNKLYINSGSNENIDFGYNGNGLVMPKENNSSNKYPLKDYNFLRAFISKGNNIKIIDSEIYSVENQKILGINSDIKLPDFIYFDKIPDINNIIRISYLEPRYAYFYAIDNFIVKNKNSKVNGYYSYFQRINTNTINYFDFFNYITFDLKDKVNVYTKKYYGYSTLYEINNEKYNIDDISFLEKPLNTYENEISKFNQLFNLKNNQLYSGHLEYDTLYDIYIEIDNDNDNETVMLPNEDNNNNLMKLFKPNINYKLKFEVNHLIKLDPNFDSEVTIKDSNNNDIILNKNNLVTKEIKGNNVELRTNSNSILYFYSPLPKLSKKIYQYELTPIKGKNFLLDIEIPDEDYCDFYYLIDFGFEGYSPFQNQSSDFIRQILLSFKFKFYIPNYYDKLDTKLVQNEKLYLYYYLDYCVSGEKNKKPIITQKYYPAINLNKTADFFVNDPNKNGQEKSIMFNIGKSDKLSFQIYFSPNNEDTNLSVIYSAFEEEGKTKYITDSQIVVLTRGESKSINLTFNSNNKFVLSYSFHDKNEENIESYSDWIKERKINYDLIINAKLNPKEKTIDINFVSNYIKSTTKYYIIIGPKTDDFTLDNFNDPCFLTDLITENSNKVKIKEFYYIEDEMFINKNIDIKDLMAQNDNNEEYLINIISQELRFDKSLNFYNAILVYDKKEDEININDEIIFNRESKYKLSYSRPDNKNQKCYFLSLFSSDSYKLSIEKKNSEDNSFIINNQSRLFSFECDYDGIYNINIIPLSESSIQGVFKISSTGFPFNLNINDFLLFNFSYTINYQPSNLNVIVNTYRLNESIFVKFEKSNLKINSKYNMSNELELFYFEKNKRYEFIIEFLQSKDESQNINYNFRTITSITYKIDKLLLKDSPVTYSNLNYSFIKIDYGKTPKFVIETEDNPKFYLVDNISESDFNSFPQKFYNYKFEPLNNLTIIKQNNSEYAILLIKFESDKNSTSIIFKEKIENIKIEFDEFYEIFIKNTYYHFEYNTTYSSDIFMLTYNLTEENTGEILIIGDNEINSQKIRYKKYDKIYFELSGGNIHKKNYKINFDFHYGENNGKFKITRITGVNYKVDINQNIIKIDKIETFKETAPLMIDLSSLQYNYIKKFDIESGKISQFISIKKYNTTNNLFYDDNFETLKSNYYYFEKNNNYTIQVKFIKVGSKYLLNPFKLIEFPQDNIERIDDSKNVVYNKSDIDKFILLDFGQFSIINIAILNRLSKINIANISFNQYQIFPKDLQDISFEKIDKDEIEIKKANNDSYIALLIDLKENPAYFDLKFENSKNSDHKDEDTDENTDKNTEQNRSRGLSTLSIVLISVSCVIFVAIVVVIIIIIKKKKSKDKNNTKLGSLQSELMDMTKSQFE